MPRGRENTKLIERHYRQKGCGWWWTWDDNIICDRAMRYNQILGTWSYWCESRLCHRTRDWPKLLRKSGVTINNLMLLLFGAERFSQYDQSDACAWFLQINPNSSSSAILGRDEHEKMRILTKHKSFGQNSQKFTWSCSAFKKALNSLSPFYYYLGEDARTEGRLHFIHEAARLLNRRPECVWILSLCIFKERNSIISSLFSFFWSANGSKN